MMTFDENYGHLPLTTLWLVRKFNVSPADFDYMTDILGMGTWSGINDHIIDNSPEGYYQPKFF